MVGLSLGMDAVSCSVCSVLRVGSGLFCSTRSSLLHALKSIIIARVAMDKMLFLISIGVWLFYSAIDVNVCTKIAQILVNRCYMVK